MKNLTCFYHNNNNSSDTNNDCGFLCVCFLDGLRTKPPRILILAIFLTSFDESDGDGTKLKGQKKTAMLHITRVSCVQEVA